MGIDQRFVTSTPQPRGRQAAGPPDLAEMRAALDRDQTRKEHAGAPPLSASDRAVVVRAIAGPRRSTRADGGAGNPATS